MKALSPGKAMATVTSLTTTVPSAQVWKDTLEEILSPQGRWSEDEYLVLTDHRNRLVEFTDGFLEILPMPTEKRPATRPRSDPNFALTSDHTDGI
jgi:hypothetical protein